MSIPDGMADVWEILDPEYSAGLATALSMQLAERGGRCVPFARRRDDDDLACLSGDGRIAIVHPNWGDGRESGWSRFHVPDDQGTMRLKFFNAPRRVGCLACGARCGAVWNVTCSNDELEYLGSCRMPVGEAVSDEPFHIFRIVARRRFAAATGGRVLWASSGIGAGPARHLR
ncbi:MAG: hypothetical protein KDJ87_08825 [Rhizobiaceae bacterium]|nr:hypothetical protein [Rhizobiaceae bacterium]